MRKILLNSVVSVLVAAATAAPAAGQEQAIPSLSEAGPSSAAPALAAPAGDASPRKAYVDLVRGEAAARGLPPEIAEAVAQIESGYNPSAVGGVGEIGLMQIRPSTAEMLGHAGGALGLFDPATNARYSVMYLAEAYRLAGGDLCRTLMKYRAGHNASWMSPLSASYCQRAKAYLATLGSPLADGAAPMVMTVAPMSVAKLAGVFKPRRPGPYLGWRPGRHTTADNARFWAAHEARIRALTAKIMRQRKVKIARGY
jgi:soluble lytic murein transglycosylase-like protein